MTDLDIMLGVATREQSWLEESERVFEEEMKAILPPPPPPPDRITHLEVMMSVTGQGMLLACGPRKMGPIRYRRMILGDRVYTWLMAVLSRYHPESKFEAMMRDPYEFHWGHLKFLLVEEVTEQLITKLEQLKMEQSLEEKQQWRKHWKSEQLKLDIQYGFKAALEEVA